MQDKRTDPDDEDDFEHFDYDVPKRAGYLVQRIDSCENCRFCDGDQEGCYYCKLYVGGMSTRGPVRQCHFVMVDPNGKCRHYKPEKDEYRLGGCASMDAMDLCFGNSRKKEGKKYRYSIKDILKGLQQIAEQEDENIEQGRE